MSTFLTLSFICLINFLLGFVLTELVNTKFNLNINSILYEKVKEKIFVGMLTALAIVPVANYYLITKSDLLYLFAFIISNIVLLILIFLAYFDFKYFKVLNDLTKITIFLIIIINLLMLYFFTNENDIILFNNLDYRPLDNLFAGFLSWASILAVVKFSKRKGMGEGDIRIGAIIGLSLGLSKLVLALYVSVFSAVILGIYVISRQVSEKSLKLRLPFVPFLVLGAIVSLYLPLNASDIVYILEQLLVS